MFAAAVDGASMAPAVAEGGRARRVRVGFGRQRVSGRLDALVVGQGSAQDGPRTLVGNRAIAIIWNFDDRIPHEREVGK